MTTIPAQAVALNIPTIRHQSYPHLDNEHAPTRPTPTRRPFLVDAVHLVKDRFDGSEKSSQQHSLQDDSVGNTAIVPEINNNNNSNITNLFLQLLESDTAEQPPPPQQQQQQQYQQQQQDNNDKELGGVKKSRLVWTQELHNRFINALSQIGLKNAVPKNVLTLMNIEGISRENVASHLQKYRIYLKRVAGHSHNEVLQPEVLQRLHERNVQQMAAQQVFQQRMAMAGGAEFDAFTAAFMGAYNFDGTLTLPTTLPRNGTAIALDSFQPPQQQLEQQEQEQQQNDDDGIKLEQHDAPDTKGPVENTGGGGGDVSQPAPAGGEEEEGVRMKFLHQ